MAHHLQGASSELSSHGEDFPMVLSDLSAYKDMFRTLKKMESIVIIEITNRL